MFNRNHLTYYKEQYYGIYLMKTNFFFDNYPTFVQTELDLYR